MLKVLHYIPGFLYGGIETMFLSWYRCIENKNVEFELLIRTQDDDATVLKEYRNQNGKYYRLPTFSVKRVFDFKKQVDQFFKTHNDYDISHTNFRVFVVRNYLEIFSKIRFGRKREKF